MKNEEPERTRFELSLLHNSRLDACFDTDSEQEKVFAQVEPHLSELLKGVNTTVLCYGMTGAGAYLSSFFLKFFGVQTELKPFQR